MAQALAKIEGFDERAAGAIALAVLLLLLAFVRPRGAPGQEPEVVAPPVRGRWTALNSPATKVPSHGVRAYGQTYAIDILHPSPPGTPTKVGWGMGIGVYGLFIASSASAFSAALAELSVGRSSPLMRAALPERFRR